MAKWLDRNVYTDNLVGKENAPDGSGGDAVNQPGLKEMTLKAIDIVQARSEGKGWLIMSEAASIVSSRSTIWLRFHANIPTGQDDARSW